MPDGIVVYAVEKWDYESDVNGSNQLSLEIEWPDGTPLEADEYNETVAEGYYLHEWVSEKLQEVGNTESDWPDSPYDDMY